MEGGCLPYSILRSPFFQAFSVGDAHVYACVTFPICSFNMLGLVSFLAPALEVFWGRVDGFYFIIYLLGLVHWYCIC